AHRPHGVRARRSDAYFEDFKDAGFHGRYAQLLCYANSCSAETCPAVRRNQPNNASVLLSRVNAMRKQVLAVFAFLCVFPALVVPQDDAAQEATHSRMPTTQPIACNPLLMQQPLRSRAFPSNPANINLQLRYGSKRLRAAQSSITRP